VTLRFLADADLKRAIVSGVKRREPGIDFRSAQAAGLEGIEDPEVLAIDLPGRPESCVPRLRNHATPFP
jgi:hypothetical protein